MSFNFKKRNITIGSNQKPDWRFVITFIIIQIIGLLVLMSASSVEGFAKFNDSYYFIKHQILNGLLPGLVLLLILAKFPYQNLQKISTLALFVSLVLLTIVFIPGIGLEFGGARSWVNLFGFSFQPAEIVKLAFLIYLAKWLTKRSESGIRDFYYSFLPFIFIVGLISILMLKQPDLGSLSVIIAMATATYFVSGAPLKHVFVWVSGGIISIFILIKTSAYRAARLTTFLHPELDPLGIGYHINQAFLAIGSGQFWGRGFGYSRQKFSYLPEVTGDSIFAIMAEELGFLFASIFIVLFVYLMYRGYLIAQRAPDQFGKLLATGIITWLIFQAFFNIGSMVGLLPMTGIPLPFVSAGGSSLVVSLAAIGILINISRYQKEK